MASTFQRMRKENYEIILHGFVQQGKSWLIFYVGCQVHQPWGKMFLLLLSYLTYCSLMEMKIPFGDQILQMDLIYIPFDQVNQTRLSTWLFSLQCCGLCLENFFF